MDIIIYLGLFGVMGALFFVALFPKDNRSSTPFLFIILFSSIFFIFQMLSPAYIYDGINNTLVYDGSGDIIGSTSKDIQKDLGGWSWVLTLSNTAFFLLGVLNLIFHKEEIHMEKF